MIVKNGKLIALPSSFGSFIKSPFLSAKGKFRILLEPFVKKSREQENESVASFFPEDLVMKFFNMQPIHFLLVFMLQNPRVLI